jgi:iron complex outermembrane receptor protein
MSMRLLAALAAALTILSPGAAPAQDGDLAPVVIEYSPDTIERLTAAEMERKAASSVWDALKGEPGVTLDQSSGRGESTITIRGSNRYQVGMYVDDVPVATAFRNEWDLANSMLFDMESIEVSKGYSSPLLAANSGSAGVINLRTHKPSQPLELLAKYRNSFDRAMADQGRMYGIRLGTRQQLFYLQAAAFEERRDFFTLPGSFTPGFLEDGGRRNNSDFKNSRINLIAGFTPTDNIDIMVGYVKQDFDRGQPFNAVERNLLPTNINASGTYMALGRRWRWPVYETERFYLNAEAGIGDRADIKLLAYYDKHRDKADSYDDWPVNGHVDLLTPYVGDSLYDQFTKGAQLRLGYEFTPAHRLEVSAGWRRLSHKTIREYNVSPGVPGDYLREHFVEDYLDFGAEYTAKPVDSLTLVVGTSWTKVTPQTELVRTSANANFTSMRNLSQTGTKLWNWQLGAFWDFTPSNQLFATLARKGRMPTMRERFQRTNDLPANPELGPEKVTHYEIGYRGKPLPWLEAVASVYHSDYSGKIDSLSNPTRWVNINSTKIWGLEIGAQARLGEMVEAGLSLSLLDGKHKEPTSTDPIIFDTPKYHGTVWASITPMAGLVITPQIDFQGPYKTDATVFGPTNQVIYFSTGGYVTADLRVTYDLGEHLTFEVGAKNIFDKLYSYSWYYPQPGRNFYLGVTAKY